MICNIWTIEINHIFLPCTLDLIKSPTLLCRLFRILIFLVPSMTNLVAWKLMKPWVIETQPKFQHLEFLYQYGSCACSNPSLTSTLPRPTDHHHPRERLGMNPDVNERMMMVGQPSASHQVIISRPLANHQTDISQHHSSISRSKATHLFSVWKQRCPVSLFWK